MIAVQMRRARIGVQRAGHGSSSGGRMFSLILDLFALDSIGVHVVDRRQANATADS